TGKSAIAHTIGNRFGTMHRLGLFFCVDRERQSEWDCKYVFSTIAWNLAG
ncbi:hypothetical protein K488DRAFT_41888, partial [Vararia minispora EC-137]